jgi:phosphoribosylformylglycinamidine synthase subunit PurL
VSDGGVLVALAEMAMASRIGAVLEGPQDVLAGTTPHGFWFGEDQARYVVTAKDAEAIAQRARTAGVPVRQIGTTGGRVLGLPEERPLRVADLIHRFEAWLPNYMAASPA